VLEKNTAKASKVFRVFIFSSSALLMERTPMMRRRTAEINLIFMARPHIKKRRMPDGIKRHRTEQCNAVRM